MQALETCFDNYDRLNVCNFVSHPDYGYTCELIKYNPAFPIITFLDDCTAGPDVTGVIFTDSRISEIPSILFPTFPHLKYIQAVNSGLESAIIEDCGENLIFIDVSQNSIRSLPNTAFDCENIETIIADENCILAIQPCETTFVENLNKLKRLSMKKTMCVDREYDLDVVTINEIESEMRKCFKMWYFM